MAEHHIKTQITGIQCQAERCYEQKELLQAWLTPSFPLQSAHNQITVRS